MLGPLAELQALAAPMVFGRANPGETLTVRVTLSTATFATFTLTTPVVPVRFWRDRQLLPTH